MNTSLRLNVNNNIKLIDLNGKNLQKRSKKLEEEEEGTFEKVNLARENSGILKKKNQFESISKAEILLNVKSKTMPTKSLVDFYKDVLIHKLSNDHLPLASLKLSKNRENDLIASHGKHLKYLELQAEKMERILELLQHCPNLTHLILNNNYHNFLNNNYRGFGIPRAEDFATKKDLPNLDKHFLQLIEMLPRDLEVLTLRGLFIDNKAAQSLVKNIPSGLKELSLMSNSIGSVKLRNDPPYNFEDDCSTSKMEMQSWLKQLPENLEKLDLSFCQLGKHLASTLAGNLPKGLKTLYLIGNFIADQEVVNEVSKSLSENCIVNAEANYI